MKKYSLQRLKILGAAVGLTLALAGCNHVEVKATEAVPSSSPVVETELPEVVTLPFVFDANMPVAIPIEEVITEDGAVGYMFPKYYHAYNVDETKPLPGMVPVLEHTEDYVINGGGGTVTYPDGTTKETGYEGSVAVYYPYAALLDAKENDEQVFLDFMDRAKRECGEDSWQYQICVDIMSGKVMDCITQVYSGEKTLS